MKVQKYLTKLKRINKGLKQKADFDCLIGNIQFMVKNKVCLIINPVSGTESKKNIPEDVAAALDQKKNDLIIRVTGYPLHASEIAREAIQEGYTSVIVAGGDGTVNEAARELVNTSTILGIIPWDRETDSPGI